LVPRSETQIGSGSSKNLGSGEILIDSLSLLTLFKDTGLILDITPELFRNKKIFENRKYSSKIRKSREKTHRKLKF